MEVDSGTAAVKVPTLGGVAGGVIEYAKPELVPSGNTVPNVYVDVSYEIPVATDVPTISVMTVM